MIKRDANIKSPIFRIKYTFLIQLGFSINFWLSSSPLESYIAALILKHQVLSTTKLPHSTYPSSNGPTYNPTLYFNVRCCNCKGLILLP